MSRVAILDKIRKSLGATADGRTRLVAAETRMMLHNRGTMPARAKVTGSEAIVPFVARLKAASISVAEAAHINDVPRLAAEFLRDNNLPARIRMGADAGLMALPWTDTPQLEMVTGRAEGSDEVSLSKALAGVAESGTLVLISGADNPTTLNFLASTSSTRCSSKPNWSCSCVARSGWFFKAAFIAILGFGSFALDFVLAIILS